MVTARLHDGSLIDIEVRGSGPAILLPVNPVPVEGPQADELRKWGVDPTLGRSLIDGLSDRFRVVAFDYEGHVMGQPMPDTLTPDNITRDFLAVADAAGVDRFAYYGYSWLAVSGLQLALRTDRLTALVMGGLPPIDGPYAEMLKVTTAAHAMSLTNPDPAPASEDWTSAEDYDWDSAAVTQPEPQTRQFMTLYLALRGFDDHAAQHQITCPRLCFVGSNDEIHYGEQWGNVHVSLAGPILRGRQELESLGWDVRVLDGLDHVQAMQPANVLPLLKPWLVSKLRS